MMPFAETKNRNASTIRANFVARFLLFAAVVSFTAGLLVVDFHHHGHTCCSGDSHPVFESGWLSSVLHCNICDYGKTISCIQAHQADTLAFLPESVRYEADSLPDIPETHVIILPGRSPPVNI